MKKTYIKPSAIEVALHTEDAILAGSGGDSMTISLTEETNAAFSESKGWSSDEWSE